MVNSKRLNVVRTLILLAMVLIFFFFFFFRFSEKLVQV